MQNEAEWVIQILASNHPRLEEWQTLLIYESECKLFQLPFEQYAETIGKKESPDWWVKVTLPMSPTDLENCINFTQYILRIEPEVRYVLSLFNTQTCERILWDAL